jgi:Fe-S-cluster containining protein
MKQQFRRPSSQDPEHIKQLLDAGEKQGFITAVELALHQVLSSLHVAEHYDRLIKQVKQERWYQNLENTWDILNPQARTREWRLLMSHLVDHAYLSRPYCVRCGECCLQGGPSLHLEDADLVAQGVFSFKHLYTLRKGERTKLNVEGKLGILQEEVIKIKGKPESGQCIFYREETRECAIHEHRPLQCKLQACWYPEPLKRIWRNKKLSRRRLLKKNEAILKLLQAHDERCCPAEVDTACNRIQQYGDETALDRLLELLRYDTTFRVVVTEKGGLPAEVLDFCFGRALQEIVRSYGMRVERDAGDNTYRLVSDVSTAL